MTKLYLIPIVIFLIEMVVIIALGKLYRAVEEENDELKAEVRKQNLNLSILVQHAEELAEIQKHESETAKKIQESKTDEEVADIITDIIAANNNRVRNDG